jgi:hypothetical protein
MDGGYTHYKMVLTTTVIFPQEETLGSLSMSLQRKDWLSSDMGMTLEMSIGSTSLII